MKNKINKSCVNKKNLHPISKKNSSSFYDTSDLYLSEFLKSKGVILHNIKRMNKKVIFVFRGEGYIQNLVKEYFNDGAKAALADLRAIIFNYEGS